MLSRNISKVMTIRGDNYPFEKVAPILRKGDIVFGNLESVIGANYTIPFYRDKPNNFIASPEVVKTLKDAGFRVLSLANNHSMDFGPDAIFETRQLLKKEGIAVFGAGENIDEARQPIVITAGGLRFGFLGYSVAHPKQAYAGRCRAGVVPICGDYIQNDIQSLRRDVDVIIVSLHWGKEYENTPTQEQRTTAHKIIEWGADMVLGHHPHVLQGIEIYKGKLIAYSLGNFIFDQRGKGTDRSIILVCTFQKNALYSVEIIPIDRFSFFSPKVAEGKVKRQILKEIRDISLPLNQEPKILSVIGL